MILKVFFFFFFFRLLPLVVRIHPLVNVRTAGVGFWLGPAEFWFSVAHLHGSTHSPPPAEAAVAAPLKVGPAPHPQRVGERDLAFPPRPRGYRTHVDTSSVPAPSLRAGVGGHLAKHLHFPQYQRDITQVHRRGGPLPEAAASGDESCLTSSVLTFPKRCLTGFVFTVIIVECRACLGSVFLFSTSKQTGLTSHRLTRRTQLM